MRFEAHDGDHVEVQMTPMIDCVFLLLIFFLVATVMKKIDYELEVDLPDSDAAIEVQMASDTMVIGINAEGEYYLNADPVSLQMLHARLREVSRKNPEQPIRIDSDRAAITQHLVHILSICRFEGFENVGIHTRPQQVAGKKRRRK